MSDNLIVSVRGEAQVEVRPDVGRLHCTITADERHKPAALAAAAARVDGVLDGLRRLGAVPRTTESARAAMSWLVRAATSSVEQDWDQRHQRHVPTGRVIATVSLGIEVRDLDTIDGLDHELALHEALHVEHVEWSVDPDNAEWRRVRAAAVQAAVRKAEDYAAALGGRVTALQEVADVGLLGPYGPSARVTAFAARSVGYEGGGGEVPSIDPVPQLVTAAVEARFLAVVAPVADPVSD